jgi:hypothetical protein
VLHDGRPNHGCSSGGKAPGDPLERRKFPAPSCERGVYLRNIKSLLERHHSRGVAYHQVADGDENDERQRVQVRQDIVGQTMRVHGGSLRGQIVVQLVKAEPCARTHEKTSCAR